MKRSVLAVVALAALGAHPAPATASPATGVAKGDCPARKGTLAKDSISRIWHRGSSIYGCSTASGNEPQTFRLGPYTTGARVAFDGEYVAFTASRVRNGRRSDRVYAVNANDGSRWLIGRRLVPATATAPRREARIQTLQVRDTSVAWVTRAGDVVMAMQEPDGDPSPIGALPGPLEVDRKLLLVGRFPATGAAALARSMRFTERYGYGDACSGTNPYKLTVRPDARPRVGVHWAGSWYSTSTGSGCD